MRTAFLLALALACGCTNGSASAARAVPPDPLFSDVVACDVAESQGSIHLLLGTQSDAEQKNFTLTYTRSDDRGATWSAPTNIPTAHAPPARMHRGDDPQVAARGSHVMALWTVRGEGPYGSGPLATALSDDGGKTWRAGPAPAARPLPLEAIAARPAAATASATSKKSHESNGTGPGYRFPAATAGGDAFHVVWIHAVGEERSLRHARLPFDGSSWSQTTLVDSRVCACCWNELHVDRDGALAVLYRDQQPSDMSVAVSRDAGRTWQPAGRAGRFDWNFDGCPHVGGGVTTLAAARDVPPSLLATVWTGDGGSTGAYVLTGSRDGNWSDPVPLTADGSRGRDTDVAALPDGRTAAAVWDQAVPEGGGQGVYAVFTADAGRSWSAPRRLSAPGENASYPRIVPAGNHFVTLWTCYAADGATTLRVRGVDPH